MKTTLLIIASLLLSLSASAKSSSVEIISSELGVEDQAHKKTLCLTVVRIPKTGALLGVVEGIQDCFYARAAKKAVSNKLSMDLSRMSAVKDRELLQHLQKIDTQLDYYYSDGE